MNYHIFENARVETVKSLLSGRKATTPVPITVKIEKVSIPIRSDFPGLYPNEHAGTFNGEWIYPQVKDNKVSRVILYMHGSAYALLSRRTHRHVTWRLAKYAHARVLCKSDN